MYLYLSMLVVCIIQNTSLARALFNHNNNVSLSLRPPVRYATETALDGWRSSPTILMMLFSNSRQTLVESRGGMKS